MAEQMNYTLGRGEIHFAQFKSNTQSPAGERYFGNTPELSYTAEQENLDHYSSDRGVRVKDQSVLLQLDYSGALTTDHISPENLAIFFLGESMVTTVAAATAQTDDFDDVQVGYSYQLGTTDLTPAGARLVANVVVKKGAADLVAGTDYVLNAELGRITILEGGAVVDGDDLEVTFDIGAHSRDRIISRSNTIEGALRFIAHNPAGKNIDYFMPWVKITPNGDFQIKADEWQTLPFTLEILKKGSLEAIYMDGRPYTP